MESVELQTACSSLGCLDKTTGGYALEPDCLATVKLLIRYLRAEPDGYTIRRQLGFARIVQNDLMPIIRYHGTATATAANRELADVVVRLLLNLTQPTLVCFRGKVPTDIMERKIFMELDGYLLSYKEAFGNVEVLRVMASQMARLLKRDQDDNLTAMQHEEDRLSLERYLLLLRNILHVVDNSQQPGSCGSTSHSTLLLAICESGLDKLILFLCSSADEFPFALHLLELLWLLFRDTPAATIAEQIRLTEKGCTNVTKTPFFQSIQTSIAPNRNAASVAARRPELKGSFVVHNKWLNNNRQLNNGLSSESTASKAVIVHRLGNSSSGHVNPFESINSVKTRAKKIGQRDIALEDVVDNASTGTSDPKVVAALAILVKKFLVEAAAYNRLMAAADRDISLARQTAENHDETFYLWAAGYFMEAARLAGIKSDCIGQTLGVEALGFVYNQVTNFATGLDMDRSDKRTWNKRLALGVIAFAEQLAWAEHLAFNHSDDIELGQTSDGESSSSLGQSLIYNVLYEQQFRDLLPQLLKRYKESKHCRAFLRAVIRAVHHFLKAVDSLSSRGEKKVLTAKARRKAKNASSKKKKRKSKNKIIDEPDPRLIEDEWINKVQQQVLNALNEELSSAEPEEESELRRFIYNPLAHCGPVRFGVVQIAKLLNDGEHRRAILGLKVAKELWVENSDVFGKIGATIAEDVDILARIYNDGNLNKEKDKADNDDIIEQGFDDDDDEDYEENEDVEQKQREVSIEVSDLALKFANPACVQAYVTLFDVFASNSDETNHHIARFFQRVCVEWKLPTLLYSLRLFRTSQRLLSLPESQQKNPAVKELVSFSKYCIGSFYKLIEEQMNAAPSPASSGLHNFKTRSLVELLFVRSRVDAVALSTGYVSLYENEVAEKQAQKEKEEKRAAAAAAKREVAAAKSAGPKLLDVGAMSRMLDDSDVGSDGEDAEAALKKLREQAEYETKEDDDLAALVGSKTSKKKKQPRKRRATKKQPIDVVSCKSKNKSKMDRMLVTTSESASSLVEKKIGNGSSSDINIADDDDDGAPLVRLLSSKTKKDIPNIAAQSRVEVDCNVITEKGNDLLDFLDDMEALPSLATIESTTTTTLAESSFQNNNNNQRVSQLAELSRKLQWNNRNDDDDSSDAAESSSSDSSVKMVVSKRMRRGEKEDNDDETPPLESQHGDLNETEPATVAVVVSVDKNTENNTLDKKTTHRRRRVISSSSESEA